MSERKMIPVDDITMDTTQSRRGLWEGDALDQRLVDSIQGIGLIHDIVVRPTNTEKYGGETEKPYALIAGSRRYHAMIQAGIYEVPCRVLELSDIEAIAMSFSENIGRKDLTEYDKMISIVTWLELLKAAGRSETEAVKEIAKMSFAGETSDVYRILQTARLPKELQILIKEPKERTEEEKHILKEHDIKPDFKMNFKTLGAVKGITDYLTELSPSERAEKIFGIIKDFDFEDESMIWPKQYEVLGSIRNRLREGKTFDIVINEVKEDMKVFTMVKPKNVTIKIPDEYVMWHKRACNRARVSGAELLRRVYFEWLEREAKKSGW